MDEWSVIEINEDFDGVHERWEVVFSVPTKYAWNGRFSYSFPKKTFSYRAAEFGYDVDDPEEREALFQHVLHEAYLATTGQLTANGPLHPLNDEPVKMKAAVRGHFDANVKRSMKITQHASPRLKVAALARTETAPPADVLDVIRNDMQIDKELIATYSKHVAGWRSQRMEAKRRTEQL